MLTLFPYLSSLISWSYYARSFGLWSPFRFSVVGPIAMWGARFQEPGLDTTMRRRRPGPHPVWDPPPRAACVLVVGVDRMRMQGAAEPPRDAVSGGGGAATTGGTRGRWRARVACIFLYFFCKVRAIYQSSSAEYYHSGGSPSDLAQVTK